MPKKKKKKKLQSMRKNTIKQITRIESGLQDGLMEDSENTVVVMGEVKEIVDEQKDKLELTKNQFNFVHKGIEDSRSETELIKEQTEICDNGRKKVVDVISNLSAISEENAASTQETTASMQELNATINLLAESSSNTVVMSKEDIGKYSEIPVTAQVMNQISKK